MRVDSSRIRKEKVADSKISGYVWTGPKSIFHRSLFKKGIITLEDLVSESNHLIVKQSSNNSHLTPTEVFLLM